jgi:glycosyltransferase involved in cell wall biosynthesis
LHQAGDLRVLHVVTSLDPGGMENGVCNIARGLAGRGVITHVACLERRGVFADRLPHPENAHVLGKRSGFSIGAVWRLWRLLRAVRPNIVHTHNLGPLIYGSLATLGGRMRPIVHGEHSQLAPWELEPRRIRQRRKLYRRCRAVHTVSPSQVEELARLGFSHPQLVAIPNGVDTERFCPGHRAEARATLGLPADAFVLGLVGRFGPFKRHDVLLAAFEAVGLRFPSSHLLLVGAGGSEETRLREVAAASSVSRKIHFAGFQADPSPAYRAMDMLVIPSINEGMSNAALEAMATGLPVLANTGCGHEQVLTSGTDGVIADLSIPTRIAAALEPFFAAPERLVDMGRAARMTVSRRFSLTSMLDAYEQLYRAHAR